MKYRFICGVILLSSIGIPLTSAVSENISYTYDAKGRLIRVDHVGAVNNGVTAVYGHDHADNRISYSVSGGATPTPTPTPTPTGPVSVGITNQAIGAQSPEIFLVKLSAVSSTIITVDYATANGTGGAPFSRGVAGVDYVAQAGTLTFSPGETEKTVTVQTMSFKIFTVNLTNASSGVAAITPSSAQGGGSGTSS